MSSFESILSSSWVTALGWTLLHFLWQGALVGGALAVVLALLRRGSAGARYLACCTGMGFMMAAPLATYLVIAQGEAASLSGAAVALPLVGAETSAFQQRLEAALPQLTMLWFLGVFVFQVRTILHWSNAQWIKHRGVQPAPAMWQRVLDDLSGGLGIRRPVRLVESSLARVPMLIGWLRPAVLVPAGVLTGLAPAQLRAILAHELAHVHRHDYLVNIVQAIFESLLFYHPAVWWLSNRLRVEREYCCDDVAVGVAGDALGYAQALSFLDAQRADIQPALASTGGTLMNRIRRLAGLPSLPSRRSGGWAAPLAVTAAVIVAASAAGLSRPVDNDNHFVHQDAEEVSFGKGPEFDIVSILKEIDAEEAEFFSVLREAGLDDQSLMIVLEGLGLEPRVMRFFEHGARQNHFIEARMHEIHDRIAADLEAGRITKEEAEQHIYEAMHELHQVLQERGTHRMKRRKEFAYFGDQFREAHQQIEEDLAAGRITEAEAHDRLGELRAKMARKRDEHRVEVMERIEVRLKKIQDQIDQDLAAGRITEEEAKQRLDLVKVELHKHLNRMFHPRHRHITEMIESKMRAVREQIHEELEAGLITEAEAKERLDAARADIHEQLKAELKQRHGKAGHKQRRHKEEAEGPAHHEWEG